MDDILFFFPDGSPDGFCSDTILCSDINSVCTDGVCKCNTGRSNIGGQCLEGNLLACVIDKISRIFNKNNQTGHFQ